MSDAALEELRCAGERSQALTEAALEFHVCTHAAIGGEVKGVLGDYGKVIAAPHYLVLSGSESPRYLLDAGYRFEQLVLEATANEIGTCWVGGFFRESSLRTALGLPEDQRIIALSPVGWPRDGSIGAKLIRAVVGSARRKPVHEVFHWERAGEPLPARILADPTWSATLEAIRRAPSWANKQPWRFVLSEQSALIYKQTRHMKEDKDYHELDCGIAMAHLHLASTALGRPGRFTLEVTTVPGVPDAEPLGLYRWGDEGT